MRLVPAQRACRRKREIDERKLAIRAASRLTTHVEKIWREAEPVLIRHGIEERTRLDEAADVKHLVVRRGDRGLPAMSTEWKRCSEIGRAHV